MPLVENEARFRAAIEAFDAANSCDPNSILVDQVSIPYELFYARHLYEWVLRLKPDASESLLLAARCQHLCRWMIPRASYDMNRTGYLKWRAELKKFHAAKSSEILRMAGYDQDVIDRVSALNLKANLGTDPDCAFLEDALCLMTLQHQLSELMMKTPREKLIQILQKTWRKMSDEGRAVALSLNYSKEESRLLEEALQS